MGGHRKGCMRLIRSVLKWLRTPQLIANAIDMVAIQNLLNSFYYLLEKNVLRHFPLLGGLDKQLKILVIFFIQQDSNTFEAGRSNRFAAASLANTMLSCESGGYQKYKIST